MKASNLKIGVKYNIELVDGSTVIATYDGRNKFGVYAFSHDDENSRSVFSCMEDSHGNIYEITEIEQKWTICFNSKEDAEFYARQIQPWAAGMITVKQI